jgi:hypothetical protein
MVSNTRVCPTRVGSFCSANAIDDLADRRDASLSELLYRDTHSSADAILTKAAELVSGDRAKTHGDKVQNHDNIAKLWSAFLGVEINPLQVALMMVLLKIARTKSGSLNLDDYIDMAGYAGVAGEIAQLESSWKDSA